MSRQRWRIGLDAGGTKTALLAEAVEGGEQARLTGADANLQRRGPEETAGILAGLVKTFLEDSPDRAVTAVCAGVSGAGRPQEQRRVEELMRRHLEPDQAAVIRVVHDAEIALEAAFEGESGVVIITGTGSIIYARTDKGNLLRAGGWGYLLGDDGSGFELGRSGLRRVAAFYDGGPETALSELLAAQHSIHSGEDLISAVYGKELAIAKVAPLVIAAAENGDAVAEKAVDDIIAALVTQVSWMLDRVAGINAQIALLGGLTNETYYRLRLSEALHERFPGWSVGEPRHPPAVGALRLAAAADELVDDAGVGQS